MKQLNVPFTPHLSGASGLRQVSEVLDHLEKNIIDEVSWPAYGYKPEAKFCIAHCNDFLFIKFYIQEHALKAVYRNINDPVYKDSCVEFFLAFNEGEPYYNFEFNCAGTCLSGYGNGRNNRELLPEKLLSKIRSQTLIKPQQAENPYIEWELTLSIPVVVFSKHDIPGLSGLKSKINFFKCGDDLPQPHYLSWNKVLADEPNFHVPASFGEVLFD